MWQGKGQAERTHQPEFIWSHERIFHAREAGGSGKPCGLTRLMQVGVWSQDPNQSLSEADISTAGARSQGQQKSSVTVGCE